MLQIVLLREACLVARFPHRRLRSRSQHGQLLAVDRVGVDADQRLARLYHPKPDDAQYLGIARTHFALFRLSDFVDDEVEGNRFFGNLNLMFLKTSSIFVSGDGIANPVSSAEQHVS